MRSLCCNNNVIILNLSIKKFKFFNFTFKLVKSHKQIIESLCILSIDFILVSVYTYIKLRERNAKRRKVKGLWDIQVVADKFDEYPAVNMPPNLEHAYVYFMEKDLDLWLND